MVISSLENDKVKGYVKLQQKKYRDLTNTYIVEGEHLVDEAYKDNLIKELLICEGFDYSYDVPCVYVSYEVMKKISTMDSVPRIMAVCNKKDYTELVGDKFLLLDDIQDPGNLGTIIRSSVAFNIDMIILSNNSVDLYNSKVLRGSQGMYSKIPIIRMDSLTAIKLLKEKNIPIYGTNVVDGYDVHCLSSDEKKSFCLVMGNEGNGVSKEIQEMCDKNLYISTNSRVESLNVGVACSILVYELGR